MKKEPSNKVAIYELISYTIVLILLLIGFRYIFMITWTPTKSMVPTVQVNDVMICNRLAYNKKSPQRGDIIVFHSKELDKTLCKRIIGIPGDNITFHNGYVYVNDEKLDESVYISDDVETNSADTFTVPESSYLVLGDNRENSNDSRFWINPYVSRKDIEAKVMWIIPTHTVFK